MIGLALARTSANHRIAHTMAFGTPVGEALAGMRNSSMWYTM